MKIEVCGRQGIEKLSQEPFTGKTALISICDHYRMPPTLRNKPTWRLSLVFDDIRLPEIHQNTLLARMGCSEEDADRIAAFVYAVNGKAERIICQCEAGVSRSAAVAAAIREHFFQDGASLFNDPLFDPNPRVYRLVLDALNKKQGEEP